MVRGILYLEHAVYKKKRGELSLLVSRVVWCYYLGLESFFCSEGKGGYEQI